MGPKNIIFISTCNQGKLREIKDLLQGEGYLIYSFTDFPHLSAIDEAAETLEHNAQKKALEGAQLTGYLTLADDSSLEIEALGGRPGVESARFLGAEATEEDRNAKILELMSRCEGEERKARFRCVIAIARPDAVLHVVKGECQGLIAERPRGTKGFGYDPIFYLPLYGKTLAELEPALKNQISHRGMAMERAKAFLREMAEQGPHKGGTDCAAA